MRTVIVVLLTLSLGSACDQAPVQSPSPRSTAEVKLPPTPDLNAVIPPKRHPGGVWTIEGVLRDATELSGTTVEVRGVVVDAHHCPKAEPGQPPAECHPPAHFYLADKAGEDRYQLLVTATRSRIVDMARVGLELTLRGRLDVVSEGGSFIRQAGLLVLPSTPEEEPPPAAAAVGEKAPEASKPAKGE